MTEEKKYYIEYEDYTDNTFGVNRQVGYETIDDVCDAKEALECNPNIKHIRIVEN